MELTVIYVLNDDCQATGRIYPFCSQLCAQQFREDEASKVNRLLGQEAKYTWGTSRRTDAKGLRCAECGELV